MPTVTSSSKPPIIEDLGPAVEEVGPAQATKTSPVGDFLKNFWEQVNPLEGIKGLAQATAHPIETYQNDAAVRQQVWEKAKKDLDSGNYASGVARTLYAFIPFVGPQLAKSGEQFQSGQFAAGAGTATGLGTALAAPTAAKGVVAKLPGAVRSAAEASAERWYQSALKPKTAAGPERLGEMVQTGLQERVPVSPSGLEKLSGLIEDLNAKVEATIQADPSRRISGGKAIANTAEVEQKFAKQVNPESDVRAIQESRSEFAKQLAPDFTLSAEEAQAMKQGTYRQLKQRAYGELKSATVESQKALARGLKEELAAQFPELDYLNTREGKALRLEPEIEKAVARYANSQLMSMGGSVTGGIVSAATRRLPLSFAAGMVKAVFDNPVLKSKIAIAINRGSKGSITIPQAVTRVSGYANAIGQAADDEVSSLAADLSSQ